MIVSSSLCAASISDIAALDDRDRLCHESSEVLGDNGLSLPDDHVGLKGALGDALVGVEESLASFGAVAVDLWRVCVKG